ncbi:MAG: hypothetical protein CM1200mP38_5910 [Dehalococcoidia bacterium]|nr:MAG: hypothetical protein CM1200mP38_5910 [Dehalococcoidia bacterium]
MAILDICLKKTVIYGPKRQFEDMMAAALGGRVAEELVFDEMTTGASSDFQQATNIARAMVTQYGMSQKLGPRTFGKREELVFLGREISEQRDYSEDVAESIDEEVYSLIDESYKKATELLKSNMSKLTQLSKYLITYETIEGEELRKLFSTEPEISPDS